MPDDDAPHVSTATAVVVNPTKTDDLAGLRAELTALLAEAGWPPPSWLPTTEADPGAGMARAAVAAGAATVLACGGDGTVMACVSALAGTAAALAVLPAGTGNLLATNLGLPTEAADVVRLVTSRAHRRIDVGAVEGPGDRSFAVMAGLGFDALLLRDAPEPVKARLGWPAYVVSALRHLRKRPFAVTVTVDEQPPVHGLARTVLVANVGSLEGGLELFPDARPDDGVLDIAIVTPRSLLAWAGLALAVARRQPRPRSMRLLRGREVQVVCDHEQERELDGDVIERGRTLTVSVQPAALLLCAPPDAPGG